MTLKEIRRQLEWMAGEESNRLYRLARRAEEHSCSQEVVSNIKDEAYELGQMNPEVLMDPFFEFTHNYAFKW
jgi:hypothetical protein